MFLILWIPPIKLFYFITNIYVGFYHLSIFIEMVDKIDISFFVQVGSRRRRSCTPRPQHGASSARLQPRAAVRPAPARGSAHGPHARCGNRGPRSRCLTCRISPLRGSTWLCPMPPKPGRALVIQRIEARPKSSVSNSASSGCCSARIASLKPIASKALFHSRTPAVTAARYFSGIVRSSQKVIGRTGSDSAAEGSFFSSRQRLT